MLIGIVRNTLAMWAVGQDSPRSLAQHASRREAGSCALKRAAGRPQPGPHKGAVAAAGHLWQAPRWAAPVVWATLASALLQEHLLAELLSSEKLASSSIGYTASVAIKC